MSERQLGSQFPGNETSDAADGWIDHDGKGMPVEAGTLVQIRNIYAEEIDGAAEFFEWVHGLDADIVAYRIVDA